MAREANISIGAKDTASRALRNVGMAAKGTAGKMNMLSLAAKGLQASFAPLLILFAGVKVIQGMASMIGDANSAFDAQTKAALGATESQREYANAIQRTLGIGDEVTLQMTRQAEAMGISKEMSQQATTAAIGLAKATGTETKEALKKVSQALQGNTQAMAEGIPALRGLTTEEEKWAAINETINRGLAMQKEDMQGVAGVTARATNSWGDMLEVIGNLLAPMRAIIAQGVAVFAEVMQNSLTPAVNMANAALENLPAILGVVNRVVIGAITGIEVVLTNLPAITEMAVSQVLLWWETLAQDAKHYFTVVIPGYVSWFTGNFFNMMVDAGSAVVTAFSNTGKNLGEMFVQLWDFVASGFEGGMEGLSRRMANAATVGIMDGFEATTTALPDLIGRDLSEREQALKDKVSTIAGSLGTEFSEKFAERMAAVSDTFADFNSDVNLAAQDANATLGGIKTDAGLTAAQGRLTTRGAQDDVGEKIARLNERSNDLLQKILDKDVPDTVIETIGGIA